MAEAPEMQAAAGATVRDAKGTGWCAVGSDGVLRYAAAAGGPVRITLDRRQLPPGGDAAPSAVVAIRLPADWRRARRLLVTAAGADLAGSPVGIAAIARVEGYVEARAGGLAGWAWHPADRARDPVLLVRPSGRGARLRIVATRQEPLLPADPPLGRRRSFAIPAARLAGLSPPFTVTCERGQPLLGSPVDPHADQRAAAAAARTVARAVPAQAPAVPRARPPAPPVAVPRRAKRTAGSAAGGIAVVLDLARLSPAAALARARSVAAGLGAGDRLLAVQAAPPAGLADSPRMRAVRVRQAGFASAAVAGMRAAAAEADVALLQADALLAPGWLKGLADALRAAPDIGVVLPLIRDPADTEAAVLARLAAPTRRLGGGVRDVVAQASPCLLIRRACLDAAGGLRGDLFAQGPGAEVDFCRRAAALGWRIVVAPGVLAGRAAGAVETSAAAALAERNRLRLAAVFPPAAAAVRAGADALVLARRRLDAALWRADGAEAVVLVTHDRGGGVERQVRQRCERLLREGKRPILLRPRPDEASGGVVLEAPEPATVPALRFALPAEWAALVALLRRLAPELVEFHHLLGHHPSVLGLPGRLGRPYDVHVHDYAWFCPRIALVSVERRHCTEPAAPRCEACVADLGRVIEEPIGVAALRRRSAAVLEAARLVVVASADVADRMERHFPALRSTVAPWEDDAAIPPPPPFRRPAAGRLRVCVIGAIGIEKGYEVLLDCARDAAARSLNLLFTVVGHTIDDARLLDTGRVFVTGEYAEAEVTGLIAAQRCHLALLPSVWPETWCFTLSQAWRAGLQVAAFDLGTPAERIRRRGNGWLLPAFLPPQAVNNALLALGS